MGELVAPVGTIAVVVVEITVTVATAGAPAVLPAGVVDTAAFALAAPSWMALGRAITDAARVAP